jgi:hypothetical protein
LNFQGNDLFASVKGNRLSGMRAGQCTTATSSVKSLPLLMAESR